MELILDDDDHMQFYPALGDVEAAVLHVVSAVSGTMQNVPTVQVHEFHSMLASSSYGLKLKPPLHVEGDWVLVKSYGNNTIWRPSNDQQSFNHDVTHKQKHKQIKQI